MSEVFFFRTTPSFSSFTSFLFPHYVAVVYSLHPSPNTSSWSCVFRCRTPVTVQKTAKQKAAGLSSAQAVAQVGYQRLSMILGFSDCFL